MELWDTRGNGEVWADGAAGAAASLAPHRCARRYCTSVAPHASSGTGASRWQNSHWWPSR